MSNETSFFSCALGLLVTSSLVLAGGLAHAAEPSDPAAAEALFAQGRELMQRGDYGQACPMLEESYRLDPATGALLALALCHEGQGKLASAWVELMNVAARAHAEHNPEREQLARGRADALGPRLSYLVLRVSPAVAELPGLVVLHDGVALRPAAWGTPIPVDPGRHVLSATAPGRKAWQTTLSIVEPAQRGVVEIPELAPLENEAAKVSTSSSPPRRLVPPAPRSMTPLRLTGVGLLGAGATAVLFAAGASWRALSKNSDAKPNCSPLPCNSSGVQQRAAANEAANFATVGVIAGGALLGAGVTLFVLGKPRDDNASHARWSLGLTPAGAELRRQF